jgi:hypothetical protein
MSGSGVAYIHYGCLLVELDGRLQSVKLRCTEG